MLQSVSSPSRAIPHHRRASPSQTQSTSTGPITSTPRFHPKRPVDQSNTRLSPTSMIVPGRVPSPRQAARRGRKRSRWPAVPLAASTSIAAEELSSAHDPSSSRPAAGGRTR